MRMGVLLEKLSEKGINMSERMVRHYLDLGLLPEPEYRFKNQAEYSDAHVLLLVIIESKKKKGMSLREIKEELASDKVIDETYEYENWLFGLYEKVEIAESWNNITTKFEIKPKAKVIKEYGQDIVKFATGSGLLPEKEIYDFAELQVLKCLSVLVDVKRKTSSGEGKTIAEFAPRLMAIAEVAEKVADLTQDHTESWLYSHLLRFLMFLKVRESLFHRDTAHWFWEWDEIFLQTFDAYQNNPPDGAPVAEYWSDYEQWLEAETKNITITDVLGPREDTD